MDITDYFPTIKTMLDDVNISFTENNYNLKFYYNDLLVNFTFTEQNVFQTIPPHFDIYFEKAFRIMKDLSPEYEQKVYNNLNKEGLLISDSGYQHLPLKKISIPQELSAYQEMIIGIKSDFSTCGLSQQTNERSDIVFTGGVSNPLITYRWNNQDPRSRSESEERACMKFENYPISALKTNIVSDTNYYTKCHLLIRKRHTNLYNYLCR